MIINLQKIQNNDDIFYINPNHDQTNHEHNNIIYMNQDNHRVIYDCDFLIHQCAIGTDLEIREMFKWNHPWILTVKDYAHKHGYCYKFDIFHNSQVLQYLNENNYTWNNKRSVLIKTFGIYCMEYAIIKYSPKWLLYLDIDVAIPPKTFYNRTLKSMLENIRTKYVTDTNRFYNDITFIAQDLEWTLNSGVIFLNNYHDRWRLTSPESDDYDIVDYWNETDRYKQRAQILMSPKLQAFFDRIKSSLHHREYSMLYGYDQVILQDVVLFYASFEFRKKTQNLTVDEIVTKHLWNKSRIDEEYLFYDKRCLEFKNVNEHNKCYWQSLNQWGFDVGKRVFGPVLLVSDDKERQYRMNMHRNYADGDVFLHCKNRDSRKLVIEWLYRYNMSIDKLCSKQRVNQC